MRLKPTMFYMALIGILFFLVLILLAVRFGITKQKLANERESEAVIHTSGIYSIVRKSPRDEVAKIKPSAKEISQYLSGQTVDIHEKKLTESDKHELLSSWQTNLESALKEMEEGDNKGLEFYYYDVHTNDDICKKSLGKGHFITRQDIYKFPELIPPFHLGCRCSLKCHKDTENIRDTSEFGMQPFIQNDEVPPLPDWKHILKI